MQEQYKTRLRNAVANSDAEVLIDLLEEEISNENLPVPLIFDVQMENFEEVTIQCVLPEINEIPEQQSNITKTGKISYKNMAKRDRITIFLNLICGLSLRVIYETFRVLPMIKKVNFMGTTVQDDPLNGQEQEIVAIHLSTSRYDLANIDLDKTAPHIALEELGGLVGINKRTGELKGLEGVARISS